jgi:hypothetical protein
LVADVPALRTAMLSLLFAFRGHLSEKLQRQRLGALFSVPHPLFRFATRM